MTINETIAAVRPLDQQIMEKAKKRWDSIAKPLHSLGKMEDLIIQIAGITGKFNVDIHKKALISMCADNGVVEEGVTQTGQEVTAIVADNFVRGTSTVCVMCQECGVDMKPVDIGMVTDALARRDLKVAYGTRNMAKGPAMTREQAEQAIRAGIAMAEELKGQGYQILATGEMGIGNTTTSSAIAAVLLSRDVEEVTGRGAGLSSIGLDKKINAIKKAIEINKPKKEDPIDVLSKVGGLDIAGLVGVFIGGAALNIPLVIDGFISAVAALVAVKICPAVKSYIIPSHLSKEPAAIAIMKELNLKPFIDCNMCLGEGTGAVAIIPLLDMALSVYGNMSTFEEINVDKYEPLS